uniref:Beta-1,3-glucosyltransferase n=1 Tax=Anthurium amnicola TaxID=1678845 RepID=A0A1D1YSL4_9ARAE
MTGAWRSWLSPPKKSRDFLCPWIKSSLCVMLLLSFTFVSYSVFSPSQYSWRCPLCLRGGRESPVTTVLYSSGAPAAAVPCSPPGPTSISHILFGIGGSARTWQGRRGYSELWWRPGETRGHVWLDEEPPGGAAAWPSTCPPYRVSRNASRFGNRASAARIARIVAEAYHNVVASGEEGVRWLVMGDDDTVFFPENLASVLGKYDHEQMWYIGGPSESVEQNVMHSYGMAFGGGGFAISSAAAAELARVLESCLDRYNYFYGSDQRVQACLSELGVPLTREPGFHQLDVRGDTFGMLAAHPVAPLVSLHHLDYMSPISPRGQTRLEALGSLVRASRFDPARTLQQSICYVPWRNWSVSVAWGYAAQVYPRVLSPPELETPLRTFTTWRSFHDGPFTFNTRPVPAEACERPFVYYLAGVREDDNRKRSRKERGHGESAGTVTEYSKYVPDKEKAVCGRPEFAAASTVDAVRVFAPKMDGDDWKKAPRRHCCETEMRRAWWGTAETMEVRIRKCRPGETLSPP